MFITWGPSDILFQNKAISELFSGYTLTSVMAIQVFKLTEACCIDSVKYVF